MGKDPTSERADSSTGSSQMNQINHRENHDQPQNALIRCTNSKPIELRPKTVFLIGNGAIKNGTKPLDEALKETPVLHHSTTISVDEFNKLNFDHKLAIVSFFLRLYRDESLNPIRNPKRGTPAKRLIKEYQKIRMNVAAKYCLMGSSLKLHAFPSRRCPVDLRAPNSATITVNWDETIWNDSSIPNVLQLHGRCSIWRSLIFPTELTQDEAIVDATKHHFLTQPPNLSHQELRKRTLRNEIAKKYGRDAVNSHLRNAHLVAIQWLEDAEQLVVWGLKGNVYDAELLSTIMASHIDQKRKNKVYIINPNKRDRDTISSLLRVSKPVRKDINPRCIF